MGGQLVGDYGQYIWPSYGLTLLVMVGLLAFSLTRLRRLKRELRAYEQTTGGRRRRRSGGADSSGGADPGENEEA